MSSLWHSPRWDSSGTCSAARSIPTTTGPEGRDGTPLRPYDSATHTMAEFMGVRVDPIDDGRQGRLRRTDRPRSRSPAKWHSGGSGYVLDGRLNASFKAVNLLLDKGIKVRRVDEAASGLRPGDFIVPSGSDADLKEVASATGVDFAALKTKPTKDHEVKQMRVGMYQRYWGGNMDEGWTRFTLEQFEFPYTTLMDEEIKKGDLRANYDVIILPHDKTGTIMGKPETRPGRPEPVYPPEYRSGIGDDGVEALKKFVDEGGTLVAFGDATEFAIEKFELTGSATSWTAFRPRSSSAPARPSR